MGGNNPPLLLNEARSPMTRSLHRGFQPTSRGPAPGDDDGHNDDDDEGGGDNHDENGEDDSQGGAGEKGKLEISDFKFVLPPTRTQWTEQMDHLVRRKYLYKLGARGIFGILEFCHFYVARLKSLILLPSHQKSKIREILRNRLAKIRADCSPFCGETFCDGIRCSGRRHASLYLEPNPSPEPNSKIEKHSLFGCNSKINTTLGNYEIPYDADSHRNPNFNSEFQYHAGLRVSLFDHFCTLFTLLHLSIYL